MTDLLSIGASGINVYQRALSTVSNNIANLNTDGYSRQTTDIDQNQPQAAGKSFIGTGAYFERVARQYDSFLEQSLQRATADLESQKSNSEYSTRLLDFLGDDEIGLMSALNKFFSSAQQMSTDPASSAYRSTMLRSSEEMATRVNSLAEQLNDLGDQAFSAMEAETESLNALAKQLASLNSQLLRKRSEENQPPALLDRRDQLLREMSEYAGITTQIDQQGVVTVSVANSTSKGFLVEGLQARQLAVSRDTSDPDTVQFQLNGGDGVEPLTTIGSGSISGLNAFLGGSLKQSKVALNDLVRVFSDEVNAIQTAGLDLNGAIGEELFVVKPAIAIDQSNVRGTSQVRSSVLAGDVPEFSDVAVTYNATNTHWSAVDPATGQVATSDENGRIVLGNVAFSISGEPKDGDRLLVSATNSPSLGLRVGLETGDQIAAASLFRVTPKETNRGGEISSVAFEPETATSGIAEIASKGAYTATERAPIGVIPAGQSEAILELDPADASAGSLQLMTRDGRHLVGNPAAVSDFSSFISQNEFFETGTTYDATHLNKTSASDGSYKDYGLEYGAFSDSENITRLLPLSNFSFGESASIDFQSGHLDLTVKSTSANTTLNLQTVSSALTTNGAVSVVGQEIFKGTGSSTTKIGDINYPFGSKTSGPLRLRVDFTNASGITPSVIDDIASQLVVSDDRDLSNADHPYRGLLMVDAFDQAGTRKLTTERTIDSDTLIPAGALDTAATSEAAIIDSTRIPTVTNAGSVIDAGDLAINGQPLGALTVGTDTDNANYGALSALDIESWIESASATGVSVDTTNEIRVEPAALQLSGSSLIINEITIGSLETGLQTKFADIEDVMHSINAKANSTGVEAAIDATGALLLRNTDGEGANIQLGPRATDESDEADATNVLGRANGVVTGSYTIRQEFDAEGTLLLSLEDGGLPADLNTIGLNTQVRLRGNLDEEIGVFLTNGPGEVAAELTQSGVGFADGLRKRLYEIEFTDDNRLEIRDTSTDTLLASRPYAGETVISYQGIQIELRTPAEPGDIFTIDGNNTAPGQAFDAQGNNQNLMRIVDLERSEVVKGATITDAYLGIVGDVGNQATQAKTSVEALTILKDQAVEARDRVSGVSLDREAADLVRFQQAYQASAQVMQVATRLFDAVLQVR
jgi:flagellar hook-associated protein FlgK